MDWSILFESQMGSGLLVVLEIRLENAAQSRFAQHNHVVKAVTADGTDQAFNVSVLPRGLRGRENFVNADPVCRLMEQLAVTPVSIVKQVPRRTVPWEGLHELLRSPLRGRVGGHGEVDGPTAIMRQHNEDEEHPERGGRHDKEVSRHQVFHVVFQEGLPSLGRGSAIVDHVF